MYLQIPTVVNQTNQPRHVHVEDVVEEDDGSTHDVGCLPNDGDVIKEDVDNKMLGVRERKARLVGAEHREEYVTDDYTKKH